MKTVKILALFLFLFSCLFTVSAQETTSLKDTILVNQDSVYTKVDTLAEYPGGEKAWKDFFKTRINGQTPTENFAPPGTYTVVITCIIGIDGKVITAVPQTSHGYGMEKEVLSVLRKLPKRFKPAYKNGVAVKSKTKFTIGFHVAPKKSSDF